jgi:hypothetical protein
MRCSLTGLAEALQGVVVDGELAFLLQAIFESGAESVESGALLRLEELLFNLILLLCLFFGEHRLMGDDFVDDPCASELRGSADLAHGHAEGGFELMTRAKIGD